MRKMAVITIAALLMPLGAFAEQTPQEKQDKYTCELAAGSCLKEADVLRNRIKKLNRNIAKGSKKYSQEDLKKLQQKLKETQDMLDKLEASK